MEIVKDENILKFGSITKVYNKYGCKCSKHNRRYEVDERNRIVICKGCGNIIDPMDALLDLAYALSEFHNEYAEFEKWKKKNRHLKPIKRIEELSSHGKYTPVCPICHNPFELYELTHFVPLFSAREQMKLRRGEQ